MVFTRRTIQGAFASALTLLLLAAPAAAQVTSGAIRGNVTATTGEPIAAAEMTATNVATGVRQGTISAANGRYIFPSLQVGRYRVEASRIGYQALVRESVRVTLGGTVVQDFAMEVSAAQLAPIVVAGARPLIDPGETGVVDLISSEEINAIPTLGRNFSDLVALSPKVGVAAGDGTGGNLSLGGGRRGANLIQIDGAGSTGTFFGGEARGSDRIPFAFSIESVQEFQVVSNGFDVEYGFFTGGVINAVTKSGTNEFHGSLFGYFQDDKFTRVDFQGREADFKSRQLGGTLSGPLIRDKLHFFVAVERQDRDQPIFGLPAPGTAPDPDTRVHPDSVARFLDILQNVYGVTDEAGGINQTQDEWSVFGRIDAQLSDKHRLTLRHNYTDLESLGDRVNPDETVGNGGVFNNTGNSFVAQLNSVFSPTLWNEFRGQYATEPRPREANVLLPEAEVNVTSDFGGGNLQTLRGLECCNDAVLPNNLEETTIELSNSLHILAGDHEVKLGGIYNHFDYLNFFFFNQQGQFDFNSLADFENMIPDDFSRSLPNPGPDGLFFTDDDVGPLADYRTSEVGLYIQDTWQASDKLNIQAGVRYDITRMLDGGPLNAQLVTDLGISTDYRPNDENFSPRLSFTYDPTGEGSSIIRGGGGLFYGRFPSVLLSNALLNTGGNQLGLFCDSDDGNVPIPDYQAFASDLSTIPTECLGGGGASAPTADINVFAPDFEYPKTWKASFGYEQEIGPGFKFDFDFLYAKTDKNFAVQDQNQILSPLFTSGIENRPVFSTVSSSGSPSSRNGRITSNFDEVLVMVSTAESRTYQFTVGLSQRGETFSWQTGYTYSDSKDNASFSCCITGTGLFETPTAGNINFLGEPGDDVNGSWGDADFTRKHTIVVSGLASLPAGFDISGIWRTTSGRPWTAVVDGNNNGDRDFGNDRAFVGTNLRFDDPVADLAQLNTHLANHSCLREAEGRIIGRNTCDNDLFTQLDMRLRKGINIRGNQKFEIIVDAFNVLNLINNDWSRQVGVLQFSDETELLRVEGFDSASNEFIYSVNPSFGEENDLNAFRTNQGTLQLGIKYIF